MQRLERFLGRGLDRIGDADEPLHGPVRHDEHHRLALRAMLVRQGIEAVRRHADRLEQLPIAERHLVAPDPPPHTLARQRLETVGVG